jgi:hypothetical protein
MVAMDLPKLAEACKQVFDMKVLYSAKSGATC